MTKFYGHPQNPAPTQIVRNPQRREPETIKPRITEHERLEIEPIPAFSGHPSFTPLPLDNPRAKRPFIREDDFPTQTALPNVGNHIEQQWTGGLEVIDDFDEMTDVDLNAPMIDNNEFLTEAALGIKPPMHVIDQRPHAVPGPASNPIQHDTMTTILATLNPDQYLLLVRGKPNCSGPKEDVERQMQDLIFNEHNPISAEDIIVVKKVSLKIGVFLE